MNVRKRASFLAAVMVIMVIVSTRLRADTGTCGGGASVTLPFTDVSAGNIFFCSIAEAYFSALTNGTTATTYSPRDPVPREQMAAFITRTQDSALKRGSRRAALGQWWTPSDPGSYRLTDVGTHPQFLVSDGADVWVSCEGSVYRVRASDGKVLDAAVGAGFPPLGTGIVIANGYICFVENINPSNVDSICRADPSGNISCLSIAPHNQLNIVGMTFDGVNLWTANFSAGGGVTRFNPSTNAVDTFVTGFTTPFDILFDGANLWVTDFGDNTLKRVDISTGSVVQSIGTGINPRSVIFDGANLWVTNYGSHSITVVRASTGVVIATLAGHGLFNPTALAFDGERVLVTNPNGDSVSLWKATDLSPIGNFPMPAGSTPIGACSDGIRFWVALFGSNQIVPF